MNPIYALLCAVAIAVLAIFIGIGLEHCLTKYQKNKLTAQKRKQYELARLKTSSPLIDITNRLY